MITRIRPFLDVEKISAALALAKGADADLTEAFEKVFCSWLGAPYAAAVHQGRSALLLALKILDIKQGDEVIVQSYIFHVVIDAILEVGAKPVLVDCSLKDFNISPEAIETEITPRTKAIIATHLGLPCDIGAIAGIAGKHNCFLIENCAHTMGAKYAGEYVGTFGDISFCSFDTDKPLSTGDGGMLIVNNSSLIEKANQVLNRYKRTPLETEKEIVYGLILQHFVTSEDIYPENGFLPVDFGKKAVKNDPLLLTLLETAIKTEADNGFREHVLPYLRESNLFCSKNHFMRNIISRVRGRLPVSSGRTQIPKIDSAELLMNSMRGAVGLECMKDFDAARKARNFNAQCYRDFLAGSAYKQAVVDDVREPAFIRYTVLNDTKYENSYISAAAKERGFELGIFNWSAPIHLCQPYNKILCFDRTRLRNSEYLGEKLLSLPVHPYIGQSTVRKIAGFLNSLAS